MRGDHQRTLTLDDRRRRPIKTIGRAPCVYTDACAQVSSSCFSNNEASDPCEDEHHVIFDCPGYGYSIQLISETLSIILRQLAIFRMMPIETVAGFLI